MRAPTNGAKESRPSAEAPIEIDIAAKLAKIVETQLVDNAANVKEKLDEIDNRSATVEWECAKFDICRANVEEKLAGFDLRSASTLAKLAEFDSRSAKVEAKLAEIDSRSALADVSDEQWESDFHGASGTPPGVVSLEVTPPPSPSGSAPSSSAWPSRPFVLYQP